MLVYVLFGSLIMSALFLFGLNLYRPDNRAAIYFALFCLVHSYYLIGSESYYLHQLLPGLPFGLTARLEYLSLYWSVALYYYFAGELFPHLIGRRLTRVAGYIVITYSLVTLLTPVWFFSALLWPFTVYMVLSFCFAIYAVARGLRRQWREIRFSAISFGFLFYNMIIQLGDNYGFWIAAPFSVLLNYLAFLFFQCLDLSRQFAKAYREQVWRAETAI